MSARFTAVLPRFLLIALGCLLASAAVTFAADKVVAPAPAPAPVAAPAEPIALVVPDVRNQVYVFAKGTLEDAGFAWKVAGPVDGYAANLVETQSPSPGTRLADTGAPLVTLTLRTNSSYEKKGEPENASPYPGTRLVMADLAVESAPAPAPKPAAKPKKKAKAAPKKAAPKRAAPKKRPPAFAVPGAPAEPLDELPLDERARQLDAWVEAHPKPSDANVQHWLYQHTWIVTGARFGWWRGEEALKILVGVDGRVERLWGVGSKSRGVAEQAFSQVRERSD